MQLSLCLLVIDIIDFSIILETNIHNQSDLLIGLTNENKYETSLIFGELTTYSQGVQL